jgi:polysaccharide biosynthesis protein PslH
MKILVVSHRVPYPLKDGGVIAMHALLQGLHKAGVQVKLLCLNPKKDNVDTAQLPQYFFDDYGFEAININTDIKPIDAFANLFTTQSYHMVRFMNEGFAQLLQKTITANNFDVIHLESLFVTGYLPAIRRHYKGPVAMRSHNVEHRIWAKLAQNAGNPLKKWYLNVLANRLKTYEETTFKQLDALVALTEEDAGFFVQHGFAGPLHIAPHGIDTDKFPYTAQPQGEPDVFHLGSMDWIPNQEAMRWFLDEIWPLVVQKFPAVQFHLAGKKIPAWFYDRKDKNVTIAGEVPNAIEFMQQHHIMVVPLLSGSGIRVKILEGMALGKPILATPRAAEGIDFTNGKDIIIGDSPQTVAQQIITLLQDKNMRTQLGQNARKLIELQYDNSIVCQGIIGFYSTL